MWDGIILQLNWIERTQEWVMYRNIVIDNCSRYGPCGPYGSCQPKGNPPCSCMNGFEPRVPKEWNVGDWSSGCQRKKPLDCGTLHDGFQKISGVKFPDTRRSCYNMSMSLVECEMACIRNCSCTAYADLDIRNGGSGCLLWFDELMDTREYDGHQQLHIRMATSDQLVYRLPESKSSFNLKNRLLTLVLSVLSAAVLLSAVAYACRKTKKRLHRNGRGNYWAHILDKDHTSVQMEDLDELPFLGLQKISKATDNFSIDNKIGEGGYGPVYRHRNLVKLLGYCIQGNEKILVYEYMENKSLDSFIFDDTTTSMLDWPQCLNIIHGLARGILYLHQDSRLQIIHRDLKPGNILLDREMNPKISDFGLARKFDGNDAMDVTKKVVGTYGYIPPEYAVHGRFSIKSDVFSFGVIVLEIVSGKKNQGFSHEAHSENLLGHAYRLYKEDKSIKLMSASLQKSCVVSEVLRSIHVALLCVQHHAADRPTMLSVVLMLISDGELPPPKQPAFFLEESYREDESVSSLQDYMITLLYAR
ncbi:unnamed protein product [Lactuca virosa]|uniref:non-specific serine/threonine protein kinase n=1 Tax=Lactuca virosa TaxID=75947 RepID=A0AAU9MV19_9ASTR|nr:unnamed protein product [Lactuca virosa]